MMAKIDVIVPAWNAEATIEPAIGSLLAQTEQDLRVIAVDDGSTDRTAAILEQLAQDDPRLHVISRPNGGVVEALRTGLAEVDAPFVARLDADDVSAPDRFERQLAHFASHPELIAVSGGHREIDGAGVETGRVYVPEPISEADPTAIPAREPQIIHSFLITRTEALLRAGGYRRVVLSEDTDLYWRLLEVGPVENLPGTLGYYRMHADSLSSKSVRNGRILSVSSQFSAVSACRRRAGRNDIDFPFDRDEADLAAHNIHRFVAAATAQMDDAETAWMRKAVAAKLMELAGYRPFELTDEDCRFIGAALNEGEPVPETARAELRKMQAATAARLMRLGRPMDAWRVIGPALVPQAIVRALTGRLYWRKHVT